jgi:hypothetical protein
MIAGLTWGAPARLSLVAGVQMPAVLAEQVPGLTVRGTAGRWYLWHNLGEAVDATSPGIASTCTQRPRRSQRQPARATPRKDSPPPAAPAVSRRGDRMAVRTAGHAAICLLAEGRSVRAIAADIGSGLGRAG